MEIANYLSMTKKNEIQHLKGMLKTVSNAYNYSELLHLKPNQLK